MAHMIIKISSFHINFLFFIIFLEFFTNYHIITSSIITVLYDFSAITSSSFSSLKLVCSMVPLLELFTYEMLLMTKFSRVSFWDYQTNSLYFFLSFSPPNWCFLLNIFFTNLGISTKHTTQKQEQKKKKKAINHIYIYKKR